MRLCLLGQDLTAFCKERCISRLILWKHALCSWHPSHFWASETPLLSPWRRFGIMATLVSSRWQRARGVPFPSEVWWNTYMLIRNCILPEIFLKISTQAKRDYTFKRIYLLLRMSAFIPRRLQRLACNECLKNPWCSISETFIAAVIVLITASAIPETCIFFSLAFIWSSQISNICGGFRQEFSPTQNKSVLNSAELSWKCRHNLRKSTEVERI